MRHLAIAFLLLPLFSLPAQALDLKEATVMIQEAEDLQKAGNPGMTDDEIRATFGGHRFDINVGGQAGTITFKEETYTAEAEGFPMISGDWKAEGGKLCHRIKEQEDFTCDAVFKVAGGYAEESMNAYRPID